MKKFLKFAFASMALLSPAAFAGSNACEGSFSLDTLPSCDASNLGLACALGDGESFQIYVCKADGWRVVRAETNLPR